MIGGIFTLWGAVVAGVFMAKLVPFFLQTEWGVDQYWLTIIFGLGMLQVLLTAPGGIAQQLPKDLANLGRLIIRLVPEAAERLGGIDVIEVEGLTVRFAGVTPIDQVTVTFPGGACGLIGPNGAGKTTFFNVLSGFVKPAAGTIQRLRRGPAEDGRLPPRTLGPPAHVPDRAGDRDAVGVRQRGDDPRALEDRSARRDARTSSRRSSTWDSTPPTRRSAGSTRATGGSSRSPARSSAGRGSCSSTSRPPASPTRRRSTWAR